MLGPTRVCNSNRTSIGSAVFAHRETDHSNVPTDRRRYSVCKNRPHLVSIAMRPNNNNNKMSTLFTVLSSRLRPWREFASLCDEYRLGAMRSPTLRPSHLTWPVSPPLWS